ncbi:MarR family winged helix-turn-helix transcriptional regulator [Streptomyces sp. NPDC056663]|uniref:MarR family winged helix-turn-helix transcriptional regulator n=1 Tax=Streptomyces sp. NPDC056663 TaxID=3345899 RepID=UPI0036AB295E
MSENALYEELMRQLSAVGSVRRDLGRIVPFGCSDGAATVLTLLGRHGAMRIGQLTELLGVNPSATSRHASHLAMLGWVDRTLDPADQRSRIVHLTPEGHEQLAELSDRRSQELAKRLTNWRDKDLHQLAHLLSRLRADFDDPGTGQHAYKAPSEDAHRARPPAA